jgi:signal transduction histidine kinase
MLMKLTKKIEQEVLKVYNTGWEAYMRGDLKTHAACLSSKFKIIGTTEAEHFNSKKAWLAFCKKTIHQVVGVAQMRNRKIKLEAVGDGVMVVENSAIYVLIEGKWQFYSKLRVTALMQKEKSGWKYVHQHGSLPDTRASENETIATEKIKKENQQLRDAVKRRTIELEEKNRELEIEAAVERVRAKALAMNKSEDVLSVVIALKNEITDLKLEAAVTATTIFLKQDDGGIRMWDLTSLSELNLSYHKNFDIIINPKEVDPRLYFIRLWRATGNYTVVEQNLADFKIMLKWLRGIDENASNEIGAIIKKYNITHGYHPAVRLSHGWLCLDLNTPPPDELKFILTKMGAAFDLAYQRFLDLQKAEAQAREAQIEASLERIRAQAMALRNSGEWKNIIRLVFQEWKKFGVSPYECSINVIDRVTREFTNWATGSNNESDALTCYKVQPWHHSYLNDFYRDFFAGVKYRTDFLKGKRWTSFLDGLFTHSDFKDAPQAYKDQLYAVKAIHVSHANNYHTSLDLFDFEPLPEDKAKVMMRIAAVVEMAYTRYLDIKTAEAQSREAQIEVAVERVRAKALAMHKSEEIMSVIKSLRQELDGLKIPGVVGTTIYLKQDDGRIRFWDITTLEENEDGAHFTMDKYLRLEECPDFLWFQRLFRQEEKYMIVGQHEEELKRSMEWIRQSINEEVALSMIAFFEETKSWHLWHPRVLLEHGVMNIDLIQPPTAEAEPILIKMGAAFDLAYKRFLDLQKAEAQAREAQIEAALEKVRSRSLAMHKSEEMREIVKAVFERLKELNFAIDGGVFIAIPDETSRTIKLWVGDEHAEYPTCFNLTYFDTSIINDIWNTGQEAGVNFICRTYPCEVKNHWFTFAFENTDFKILPRELKNWIIDQEFLTQTFAMAKYSGIGIHFHHERILTENEIDVIKRFGKVFEQGYVRFLDLQKAEAQAREAQIEVAVERVRAQSMAMHHPDDLDLVNKELLNQLHQLQISGLTGVTFYLVNENGWVKAWDFSSPGNIGAPNSYMLQFDFTKYEMIGEPFRVLLHSDQDYYVADYPLEKLEKAVYEIEEINSVVATVVKEALASGKLTHQWSACAKIANGILGVDLVNPPSGDTKSIVLKMAGAFNQAYTRFLDLQKAEAQAREAQIEASLERVRAKAMGMHHSDELSDVLVVLFQQFDILNIHPTFTVINLFDVDNNKFTHITTGKGGMRVIAQQTIALDALETWQEMVEDWGKYNKTQMVKTVHYPVEVIPKVFEIFHEIRLAIPEEGRAQIEDFPNGMFHTLSYCQFGNIGFVHVRAATDEEKNILSRFAREFDRLYQRFLDLQKAEAQAREAQIEAALEKVRGKAMAMHSSQDLADTIGVFYQELQNFSITPRRCGVGLLNKENREGEIFTWNTTEDGHSLELVGKIKMEGHSVLEQVYENWVAQTEFHPVLRGKEISEYYKIIRPQMPFPDYNNDDVQYGYFFFFMEGGVYAWTGKEMSEDELNIYRRFTSALSLTYKRYKDLKIAEAHAEQAELDLIKLKEEKKRTEDALTELQITQKQLIQAEKMASLGELTAGIAHEIQNPLNFVNNFSEVSNELIQEIQDIRRKTCLPDRQAQGESLKSEEDELLKDIASNLEKILHHGKRADGIVKGMLQHSRSSSGVKEPTGINALADEYLRLAYHGLRAKDKSFNASMKTDFDESIGKINIVPQDIGRVILNLITNAFYAVNEKAKLQAAGYEPQVIVSTEKLDNKIEICVKDNGNGIPEQIKEKIFQPFFTTKPTGQGTGLGLSLSYDIVKAHGGNLYVETKESEGTIFTIGLPI